MMKYTIATATSLMALAAAALVPAHAVPSRVQSGTWGGGTWTAQSTIVGQTSTATIAGGGDPLYLPQRPQKNGVVQLIIDYAGLGGFSCSGSLASDRRSIITAAHCASEIQGIKPKITAFFHRENDDPAYLSPLSVAVQVGKINIAPDYTGYVIDQSDVAVLRLRNNERAPDWATAYDIYAGDELTGQEFNVAGYGLRSDTGGAVGANLSFGRLREGWNVYGHRIGDAVWEGELDGLFGEDLEAGYTVDDYNYSYWADFDNGTEINDAPCQIAIAVELDESALCDTGLGAREASIAGGDSGGPGFIDGQLATVNSYGLTFGDDFGDYSGGLNAGWGEFAGYVPLFLHRDWIESLLQVPEPGTLALFGLGLGLIGLRARRSAR